MREMRDQCIATEFSSVLFFSELLHWTWGHAHLRGTAEYGRSVPRGVVRAARAPVANSRGDQLSQVTLQHCDDREVKFLPPPRSGALSLTIGGQPGNGTVNVYSQASGIGFLGNVDTGATGAVAINQASSVWMHYVADPGAPQSVTVTYTVP